MTHWTSLISVFACVAGVHGDRSRNQMNCGANVPLCGTLTIQTGLAGGVYHSAEPKVHGLWPECGQYGTSKCIAPQDSAAPTKIYPCYNDANDTHALWFENHEWTRHGVCAGVKNVDDFFGQVCSLSNDPISALTKVKDADKSKGFDALAQALRDQKFPVWDVDEKNDQVMLSACAGDDGRWVLATVSEMPSKCHGSSPGPSPSPPGPSPPAPAPPSTNQCVPGRHGPACTSDSDCKAVHGCVRCAHSGFCTDQPISSIVV